MLNWIPSENLSRGLDKGAPCHHAPSSMQLLQSAVLPSAASTGRRHVSLGLQGRHTAVSHHLLCARPSSTCSEHITGTGPGP